MTVSEFRGDDRGYLNWIAAHPHGYVVNIQRSLNPSDARLHRADCRTISGNNPRGGPWTGPYIKLCSVDIRELDDWAQAADVGPITRCGICHPSRSQTRDPHRARRAKPTRRLQSTGNHRDTLRPTTSTARTPPRHRPTPASGTRAWEIRGPMPRQPVIEAWIDDYIRFERRPAGQEELRTAIRDRLRRLSARPGEVLHATFLGRKHPAADVENLALYYIDDTGQCFANAARFGLRFELAARCPISPTGKEYAYGYRYELAPQKAGFRHWNEQRELVSWDWIELGTFAGDKKLEQVWLALARLALHVASPSREADVPFAVRVTVRAPRSIAPAVGYLVKGVFDGVVSAFQAHTDSSNVAELAARVSKTVPATAKEIQALLLNEQKAVLGSVPRLLHLRGAGVQWAPADDLCVAGELLADRAGTSAWAIRGQIIEVRGA